MTSCLPLIGEGYDERKSNYNTQQSALLRYTVTYFVTLRKLSSILTTSYNLK